MNVLLALGTGAIVAIVIGGVLLLLIIWLIGMYNGLVAMRNRVKNAWAQIDVQLQRRYDLIPNLVETAKGYMKHESETLEAVTQARNMAQSAAGAMGADPTSAANMKAFAGAEAGLSGVLGRLMAVAEALSRSQGQREHDAGARGIDDHREQSCFFSPGLQRLGHALQQWSAAIPIEHCCWNVQLCRVGNVGSGKR